MGSDPYAGYLQANSEQWWFIGSAPEYAGGDSFNGLTQSWSGFYADRNGWRKSLRVFRMTRVQARMVQWVGFDYAVLEKQFGEPIADGRLTASQTWMEILSSDD